jgi:hypothetical protein
MAAQDVTPLALRNPASHKLLLWLLPAAAYYALLLTAGGSGLFAPVMHGLTFNSMLEHLLHGRFDVDAATIGDEGFLRDGAVYAYFGIFPALVRAVFLWLPNFATTDFTRLCCLVAVSLMALFKVLSALTVWRAGEVERSPRLLALFTVALLASGPQIEFLRPSIFQEAVLWADAAAAGFVLLLLRGLTRDEGFSPALLAGLAAAAGIALLTRVSTGLGLCVAFGLVWLWLAGHRLRGREGAKPVGLAASAAIAAGFVAATGCINFGRWGNPLVFADFSAALIAGRYPEQFPAVARYGEFNPIRIGYALNYYFLPLWTLRDGAGQLWWTAFQQRAIGTVELPPGSFLLSDPLLLGLAVLGLAAVWRQRGTPRRALALLAGAGLCVPVALMLCASSMTLRYRMEFYPFFEFFGFLGFARAAARPRPATGRLFGWGAVCGVVGSHVTWLLYMLSPFGPAGRVIGTLGIAGFYRSLFQ